MNPELVSLLPEKTISTLSQSDIKCFNWYWAEEDEFDLEERNNFQCPENECDITTNKDRFCCHRYVVIHRLMNDLSLENDSHVCLRTDPDQTVQPQSKVIQGLKDIVSKYEEECRPEYLAYGDGCFRVAKELGGYYFYNPPFSNVTESSAVNVTFINTTSTPLSIVNPTNTLSTLSNTMSTLDKITVTRKSQKEQPNSMLWIFLLILVIVALVLLFVCLMSYYYRQRWRSKKKERERVIALKKTDGKPLELEISTPTSSDDSVPSKTDDTISVRTDI